MRNSYLNRCICIRYYLESNYLFNFQENTAYAYHSILYSYIYINKSHFYFYSYTFFCDDNSPLQNILSAFDLFFIIDFKCVGFTLWPGIYIYIFYNLFATTKRCQLIVRLSTDIETRHWQKMGKCRLLSTSNDNFTWCTIINN